MSNDFWISRMKFEHPLICALVLSLNGDGCEWGVGEFECTTFDIGPNGERNGRRCTLSARVNGSRLRVEAQDGFSSVAAIRPKDWWTVEQVTAFAALLDGTLRPAFELLDDALVLMRHPEGEEAEGREA